MARLLFSLIRLSSLPSFIYPVQSYAFQQQTPIARSFSKFNCLSRNVGRLFFGSGSSSSIASSVDPIFSSQDKVKESIAKLTPLPSTQNIKGVIFDMDGTLVKPCIDFADMRRRIYDISDNDPKIKRSGDEKKERGDILEIYSRLSTEGQMQVDVIFQDIEAKAIKDMSFMEGIAEICNYLDGEGIHRALLTRNVQTSIDAMHEKLLKQMSIKERFSPAVGRDSMVDGIVLPPKPAPDAILHICKVWECSPKDVIMVGDSAADDIASAFRAGCGGRVLLQLDGQVLDNNSSGHSDPQVHEEVAERKPTLTVISLMQLIEVMVAANDEV